MKLKTLASPTSLSELSLEQIRSTMKQYKREIAEPRIQVFQACATRYGGSC